MRYTKFEMHASYWAKTVNVATIEGSKYVVTNYGSWILLEHFDVPLPKDKVGLQMVRKN